MQLLQCTASLPGGSGQCNSCNALPHCLGAVGSVTPAIHCRTVWGQWTVQLLRRTASLPGRSAQCNSCNTLPHRLGAVGSATPATHCRTAWEQWAVQFLQCTAPLPGGSGQCNSCNTLPHRLGAVDSETSAMHCPSAWGQWAAQLLQRTASLPGSSGQCNSCNALPHCLGAVGGATFAMGGRSVLQGLWGCTTRRNSLGGWGVHPRGWSGHPSGPMGGHHLRRTGRTGLGGDGESSPGGGRSLLQGPWGASIFQGGPPAIHCLTARGQRAVDLLQRTAPLPRGSGQWTSGNTLPHCLGAMGSGPPAMHCLTA